MIGIGLVGGPIILIYVLELVNGTWLVPIFAIAGIFMFFGMGIMGIIQLFMEAPSYAKYKKKGKRIFPENENGYRTN